MTELESLATELRSWLLEHDMWMDVTIYFDGKAFSTSDRNGHFYYNDPTHLVEIENADPHEITEYAGELLTMTFEGPLYHLLNYGEPDWSLANEFSSIFNKHGYWYEQSHAWDLTIYKEGS